jgi:hypothetical protein
MSADAKPCRRTWKPTEDAARAKCAPNGIAFERSIADFSGERKAVAEPPSEGGIPLLERNPA